MRIAQVRTFVIRPTRMHTEGEVRTADYVHAQACAVRADLWNPSLTQSERNVSPITTVEGVANYTEPSVTSNNRHFQYLGVIALKRWLYIRLIQSQHAMF